MTTANGTETLATALLAFQTDPPKLERDKTNPHFKNKYASLDSVMDRVLPALTKNGLVWTTWPSRDENGPCLRYRLTHASSGQSMDATMPLLLQKNDSQGLGSAITYARRYSIVSVLGLVVDEDDDGHEASQASQKPVQAPVNGRASLLELGELAEAFKARGVSKEQVRTTLQAAGVVNINPEKMLDGLTSEQVAGLLKTLAP